MNAGRKPSWSKRTYNLTKPFFRLHCIQRNIEKHRSMVVDSRENSLFLNEFTPQNTLIASGTVPRRRARQGGLTLKFL